MKRRDFVGLAGAGCVLPVAIAACTSQDKQALTTDVQGFEAIGTVSDLKAKGEVLAEKTAIGKVLVVVDPKDTNHIIAVKPICSHAHCTVTWQKDQSIFVCPCHDSKFALDGKVLQGPADKPLPLYLAKIDGNSILVKAS
jgi:cytochrome b6-f complex iron-sulfur subunit